MAARRLTVQEREAATEAEPEFVAYDADLNYDADTEEALETLRKSFADGETKGTMWVYRVPTDERGEPLGNAKQTMCFNVPLDRYELEELSAKLRVEYMKPGERAVFRITATMRGQQGMKLNRLLILQRENVTAKEEPQRESFAELLRLMQESNAAAAERTERLLTAFTLRSQSAPVVDPMDAAMRMMTVMTGMTQALVARVAPGAATVDPMASLTSAMGVMRQMQKMMGEANLGGSEDPDSPVAILRAAAPIANVVGQLLQRAPQAQAMPTSARRRIANPVAPTVTPPQATPLAKAPPIGSPQDAQDRHMLAQLMPQLEALTNSAVQGADPTAVAVVVLEAFEADSPEEARFMGFLERSNWWALLSGVYPAAAPHAEWFEKLRAAILAEFEEGGSAEAQ